MNKRNLLLLCFPSNEEINLNSLLTKYVNEYGNKESAEILAFKNSLLLGKSNLNNNTLNGLLLKNYVLYLFNNKKIEDNEFNNSLLNSDINTTIELLNKNMSIKYFLCYLYVKSLDKGSISKGLDISEENANKAGSLLKEINFVISNNEVINATRKLNNRFTRRVSNR